jgi:hypothetical protein
MPRATVGRPRAPCAFCGAARAARVRSVDRDLRVEHAGRSYPACSACKTRSRLASSKYALIPVHATTAGAAAPTRATWTPARGITLPCTLIERDASTSVVVVHTGRGDIKRRIPTRELDADAPLEVAFA